MRLNLGCGKVLFPWTAEKEAERNPLLQIPDSVCAPDWKNVDALPLPGVDEVVDLFAYPWPWEDNSVDEIWASHLIEHIPHVPRLAIPCNLCRWHELENLDGFYAFFAEAYRVLKPDGAMGIVVPYGKSDGAIYDPQHTRFITETTFHYLSNGGANSPTYDYKLPLSFEVVGSVLFQFHPRWQGKTPAELEVLLSLFWNVAVNMQINLRAVK